jgi:hypothetical protein
MEPEQREETRPWLAQRGLNMKLYLAVDKAGHPLKVVATKSRESDCKRALELISYINTKCAIADKAYDSDEIILSLSSRGIVSLIPPKINRIFNASTTRTSTKNGISLKIPSSRLKSGSLLSLH